MAAQIFWNLILKNKSQLQISQEYVRQFLHIVLQASLQVWIKINKLGGKKKDPSQKCIDLWKTHPRYKSDRGVFPSQN